MHARCARLVGSRTPSVSDRTRVRPWRGRTCPMPPTARILLVDDHEDTLYALESALARSDSRWAGPPAATRRSSSCCAATSACSCSTPTCPAPAASTSCAGCAAWSRPGTYPSSCSPASPATTGSAPPPTASAWPTSSPPPSTLGAAHQGAPPLRHPPAPARPGGRAALPARPARRRRRPAARPAPPRRTRTCPHAAPGGTPRSSAGTGHRPRTPSSSVPRRRHQAAWRPCPY